MSVTTFYHVYLSHIRSYYNNLPAPPNTNTLSLHDALPISERGPPHPEGCGIPVCLCRLRFQPSDDSPRSLDKLDIIRDSLVDRKITRLNSSHLGISYAVFCLIKKINI